MNKRDYFELYIVCIKKTKAGLILNKSIKYIIYDKVKKFNDGFFEFSLCSDVYALAVLFCSRVLTLYLKC